VGKLNQKKKCRLKHLFSISSNEHHSATMAIVTKNSKTLAKNMFFVCCSSTSFQLNCVLLCAKTRSHSEVTVENTREQRTFIACRYFETHSPVKVQRKSVPKNMMVRSKNDKIFNM
jgi:hypothetical protein